MKYTKANGAITDEMSIVDVLTKLIFDADSELQESELMVIELLTQVVESLAGESRRDISEYLRAMGVDEMITVVNHIKRLIDQQQGLIAAARHKNSNSLHH